MRQPNSTRYQKVLLKKRRFLRGILAVGVMLAASMAAVAAGHDEKDPVTDKVEPVKVEPTAPGHATPANLAEKATDPSAVLMQMQFQWFDTKIEHSNFHVSKFVMQPVIPLSKKNVVRMTLPWLSMPGEENRTRGLGDLSGIDFWLWHKGKSTIGFGPAFSIPTATDDTLGSGKLSLGPDLLWIYAGVPKTTLGVLVTYLHSVAGDGDRDNVNAVALQPIYTHHKKWGYFGWTSQQASYSWESGLWQAPVGFLVGKVFMAKHVPWNINVEPFVMIKHERPNDYGIKFQWTAIFPKFHW